jgi:DNA mismatch repair protein MutS
MDKKLTPMLEQYFELKQKYQDMMLFFRLGDFYEMFDEDAKEGARLLGLTLTARYRGTVQEMPMCGVPYHSAEHYIAKLTKAGKRVAICEQLSDPNLPGIV